MVWSAGRISPRGDPLTPSDGPGPQASPGTPADQAYLAWSRAAARESAVLIRGERSPVDPARTSDTASRCDRGSAASSSVNSRAAGNAAVTSGGSAAGEPSSGMREPIRRRRPRSLSMLRLRFLTIATSHAASFAGSASDAAADQPASRASCTASSASFRSSRMLTATPNNVGRSRSATSSHDTTVPASRRSIAHPVRVHLLTRGGGQGRFCGRPLHDPCSRERPRSTPSPGSGATRGRRRGILRPPGLRLTSE